MKRRVTRNCNVCSCSREVRLLGLRGVSERGSTGGGGGMMGGETRLGDYSERFYCDYDYAVYYKLCTLLILT